MRASMSGEYAERGEYHKHLDPNWSYYPIYLRKVALVDEIVYGLPSSSKILDAGCGEGVLVEKYHKKGRDIIGCDLNYESELVRKADILSMPFPDGAFDLVLFLDVIEHLPLSAQEGAMRELKRVLKQTGSLVLSIPNLAHLNSRWAFLFTGKLRRTAAIAKHPGDRPISEYLDLLKGCGFDVVRRVPIHLTLPSLLERAGKKLLPGPFDRIRFWPRWNPNLCFLNVLVVKNR